MRVLLVRSCLASSALADRRASGHVEMTVWIVGCGWGGWA
jgi:hypothetical protein